MRVITFNLRNHSDRWEERFPLVVQALLAEKADLIGFQEVSLAVGQLNQAEQIAEQLNAKLGAPFYTPYLTHCRGELNGREGIAILSRLPVLAFDEIALPNIWRVAQKVQVLTGDLPVTFHNTHLHHEPPNDESIRLPQAQAVLDWMSLSETPNILTGDMNASPNSSTIQSYKRVLTSAYEACHGREPDFTFPTPLTTQGQTPNRLAIDYIFFSQGSLQVQECHLIGNRQLTADPALYPSDHFGLSANFTFPK
jgi:endonuclease/exonuclease/phosphatase family metal-dependent hydrolase